MQEATTTPDLFHLTETEFFKNLRQGLLSEDLHIIPINIKKRFEGTDISTESRISLILHYLFSQFSTF